MALSKIDVENMVTGEVNVANGGTGLSSGTTNQFLKFTGSTTLASAADNAGAVVQRVMTQKQKVPSDIVTTSTSFESSGIEVTITPTSASNITINTTTLTTGQTINFSTEINTFNNSIDSNTLLILELLFLTFLVFLYPIIFL